MENRSACFSISSDFRISFRKYICRFCNHVRTKDIYHQQQSDIIVCYTMRAWPGVSGSVYFDHVLDDFAKKKVKFR